MNRPFRHLCPEADRRDAMTDDEFWADVARNLTGLTWDDEPTWDGPDLDVQVSREPCPECGAPGACAWDSEGRPLIHATDPDQEEADQ